MLRLYLQHIMTYAPQGIYFRNKRNIIRCSSRYSVSKEHLTSSSMYVCLSVCHFFPIGVGNLHDRGLFLLINATGGAIVGTNCCETDFRSYWCKNCLRRNNDL
jgi:hypothetical protein